MIVRVYPCAKDHGVEALAIHLSQYGRLAYVTAGFVEEAVHISSLKVLPGVLEGQYYRG
jgi:hypothetical protein